MLRCVSCGKNYEVKTNRQICGCGEPLELDFFSGKVKSGKTAWERYRDFFPFEISKKLSLSEGDTSLIKANKLSKKYDVELHLKNETVNPTGSFKDRGTVLSLQRAVELRVKRIGTVSTGNMGASVAAYGKRAGLEPVILVSDDISCEKLGGIAAYEPTLVKVSGDYGDLFYESLDIHGDYTNIYFSNSNSPYRIEGYKTLGFELVEESVPDFVMIPTSSGGLLRGVMKGFMELESSGFIDDIPVIVCVQAKGCSPIDRAFERCQTSIRGWKEPCTLARAIANPYPPGGNRILRLLDEFDGLSTAVSDEEIVSAQRDIASEGVLCQPASAVGVAAVKKLRENGIIEKGAEIVSVITGSGLKHDHSDFIQSEIYNIGLLELKELFEREFDR